MDSSSLTRLQLAIKSRMKGRGYDRKRLSRAAGASEEYVSSLLRGRIRNPDIDKINAIAIALGCTIDDLVAGREQALQMQPKAAEGSGYHKMDTAALVDATAWVERVSQQEGIVLDPRQKGHAIARVYDWNTRRAAAGLDYHCDAMLVRTFIEAVIELTAAPA
jgi:transcriptional regulator with XRE-family HTH domain